MDERTSALVGRYRCISLENTVPYCEKLGVKKFLLKLVPLAPFPQMSLSFNSLTEEFTFIGSFKVGPFSFEDRHVFKTDRSTSRMKIAPGVFGSAFASWENSTLVVKVYPIHDDSRTKTLPQNQHIVISRYIDENKAFIGDHKLYEGSRDGIEMVSWQRVAWQKIEE